MQALSWNTFGQKFESKQSSFEDLAMFLCCRELGISKIDSYRNQPGIETEPFKAKGKVYGFQAKYFDSTFKWTQVENSVNKALTTYDLDTLFIYSNLPKTLGKDGVAKSDPETRIDKLAAAKKVQVEFITDKDIFLKLNAPANFVLAQMYFSVCDDLAFIRGSVEPKKLAIVQSNEYLDLSFDNQNDFAAVVDALKDSNHQPILITGSPGSGKTLIMHKLLQRLGGLDLFDEAEMRKHLLDQDALPILVNLKNCSSESFDHLIRGRRSDAGLDARARCIYLLDGLDELSNDRAILILNQIYETSAKASTHSIVISCRTGNPNRITTKSYFPNAVEYHISDLDKNSIEEYFTAKNESSKTKMLLSIKNSDLLGDIKDVLLLRLLWETIESLDARSTIIDLFEEKIRLLLSSPSHSRNIESLNLPTPKLEAILSLSEDIAYDIQDKFQFRLYHQDLLNRVLKKFPRTDYRDANQIVSYIAEIFFESTEPTMMVTVQQHIFFSIDDFRNIFSCDVYLLNMRRIQAFYARKA
ncbi:MAG: hypothetical protein IPK98_02490 [Chloracidobacterium sp.]|nr:hypothetical protein [Chloracidobacterium sp.]